MDKETFEYQHTGPADKQYTVPWTGYVGGDIPPGLIVARLAKLGAATEPATLWTVFHKSGYVVNYAVALHTRRQAVSFAAELGKIADKHGFTWDTDRVELTKKLVAAGVYNQIKINEIPAAIRQAMQA